MTENIQKGTQFNDQDINIRCALKIKERIKKKKKKKKKKTFYKTISMTKNAQEIIEYYSFVGD